MSKLSKLGQPNLIFFSFRVVHCSICWVLNSPFFLFRLPNLAVREASLVLPLRQRDLSSKYVSFRIIRPIHILSSSSSSLRSADISNALICFRCHLRCFYMSSYEEKAFTNSSLSLALLLSHRLWPTSSSRLKAVQGILQG